MKDPKVGERCVFYNGNERIVGEVYTVGELIGFKCEGFVRFAHPNQLRRLVKKPKMREWWVRPSVRQDSVYGWEAFKNRPECNEPPGGAPYDWVLVREVRKRK